MEIVTELFNSDTCGKISEKSIGRAQDFLTLTDDKSRHSWVYILHTKDQVFDHVREWKALVERTTRKKVKTLRTDNGGEHTSNEFDSYMKKYGMQAS